MMNTTARILLVFLVCSGIWNSRQKAPVQDSEHVEISRLRVQCCNAAMPWYGLGNFGWPSAVYFIAKNAEQPCIRDFLNVTEDQVQKIAGIGLDEKMATDFVDQLIDIAEDIPDAKELWSIFDHDQLWKLELVRLKTEGLAALRSDMIATRLQLDESQRFEISKKIQMYRREYFLPQFSRGFADSSAIRSHSVKSWFFTQKIIEFNLRVLDSLKPKQQIQLASMFQELEDNPNAPQCIQDIALEKMFSPKNKQN